MEPIPVPSAIQEESRASWAAFDQLRPVLQHLELALHSAGNPAKVSGGKSTILRFSRATTAEELFTGQWQSRTTKLDAYKPYLDQRWQEGCTSAWKLWEEIRKRGYPDGYGNASPTWLQTCTVTNCRSGSNQPEPLPTCPVSAGVDDHAIPQADTQFRRCWGQGQSHQSTTSRWRFAASM
ncbi:hypothetical protein ACFVWZ_02095 [Streptomyces sp. NPDC058200]|uniref:hypothetical protein n=1 Tax=Streptomyces sp. NPDC058200 TaxID=3346378 RepID=UPI0036E13214